MKNLFITHLYRQGNGDIIQLLSNIHNAVSNNAYILFDNSFTRDGIKRPFSYEEQFAVLENHIKKIRTKFLLRKTARNSWRWG